MRPAVNFLDPRLPDRFWVRVQPCPMTGCWVWTGSTNPGGYGVTKTGKVNPNGKRQATSVHLFAWRRTVGPVPNGLHLDHLCRLRCCCNPAHLEPVTPRENNRRANSPTSRLAERTHCKNGHPFAGVNLFTNTDGTRGCRACDRTFALAHYHRKMAALRQGAS